jgi:hypothetical protein
MRNLLGNNRPSLWLLCVSLAFSAVMISLFSSLGMLITIVTNFILLVIMRKIAMLEGAWQRTFIQAFAR